MLTPGAMFSVGMLSVAVAALQPGRGEAQACRGSKLKGQLQALAMLRAGGTGGRTAMEGHGEAHEHEASDPYVELRQATAASASKVKASMAAVCKIVKVQTAQLSSARHGASSTTITKKKKYGLFRFRTWRHCHWSVVAPAFVSACPMRSRGRCYPKPRTI